MAAVIFNYVIK